MSFLFTLSIPTKSTAKNRHKTPSYLPGYIYILKAGPHYYNAQLIVYNKQHRSTSSNWKSFKPCINLWKSLVKLKVFINQLVIDPSTSSFPHFHLPLLTSSLLYMEACFCLRIKKGNCKVLSQNIMLNLSIVTLFLIIAPVELAIVFFFYLRILFLILKLSLYNS